MATSEHRRAAEEPRARARLVIPHVFAVLAFASADLRAQDDRWEVDAPLPQALTAPANGMPIA